MIHVLHRNNFKIAVELHLSGRWLSGPPIIRTLVIRTSNYPDWLGPSGKFVENSTQLTCP